MAQVAPPVDIESLTNTLGTAVLNADDGSVVKASGELESDLELKLELELEVESK